MKPNVFDLEPGRVLDALVAEHVFGDVVAHAPCGDGMTRTVEFSGSTLAECDEQIRRVHAKHVEQGMKLWPAEYCGPEYSTDIAAAWAVVVNLARRGWKVDVQNRYWPCWATHINFPAPDYRHVYEKAEGEYGAATSICLAALVALNVVEGRLSRTPPTEAAS